MFFWKYIKVIFFIFLNLFLILASQNNIKNNFFNCFVKTLQTASYKFFNSSTGRTSNFNGSTVYPFGYVLSYTQFGYKPTSSKRSVHIKLENDSHKPPCPAIRVDDLDCNYQFEVEVQNEGSIDGSEVAIVYSKPPEGNLS